MEPLSIMAIFAAAYFVANDSNYGSNLGLTPSPPQPAIENVGAEGTFTENGGFIPKGLSEFVAATEENIRKIPSRMQRATGYKLAKA